MIRTSKNIVKQKRERKDKGIYFYAVVPLSEERNFGEIGMNGAEVYTILHRNIASVVSNTPIKEFELTEENVMRHQAVLRRIMEEHTAVPVEFGAVIHDVKILKRLIRRSYNTMRECLKLVDNRVELGVKALLKSDITTFDKKNLKFSLKTILESLKKEAEQSISGELFSDRLLLNESFLVKKDNINAFSEEVAKIAENYPNIRFLYSGPWAPYSFICIKIGKEGLELGKKK